MWDTFISGGLTQGDLLYRRITCHRSHLFPVHVCQLCGDNAECTFDAIVVGTDVAEATLQTAEEFQVYQEEVGGERQGTYVFRSLQ